ncbi:hypothetical protein [Mesorhizobium sp. M1273]|uniref:hypothetical protein n=1 Tax=Mesorhizobium sp. M1273 TaxID=2957075 RepID=UPI003337DD00
MAQQERKQHLALLAQILARRGPHPHHVAHRFMHRIWNPDSLQFSSPQQPRQTDRIAPVRLDALARALGDQRRRNDIAALTELDDLPVKPVAVGRGLRSRKWRRGCSM